jgi:hypothetical protein
MTSALIKHSVKSFFSQNLVVVLEMVLPQEITLETMEAVD